MAIDPITEWAKAVWDGLVSGEVLQDTWRRAHVVVGTSARPFSAVEGPAGAMLASCARLGWAAPSCRILMDCSGALIDLGRTCPAQVRLHALDDLRRREAEGSSLAARIGGPPDLEPLVDMLASQKATCSKASASLRALGEGGWWTQSRLHEQGTADDPWCRACLDIRKEMRLGPALGTLHHCFCGCLATADLRSRCKHQDVLARAQRVLYGQGSLFVALSARSAIAGGQEPHTNAHSACMWRWVTLSRLHLLGGGRHRRCNVHPVSS